jgi:hypothetical protein
LQNRSAAPFQQLIRKIVIESRTDQQTSLKIFLSRLFAPLAQSVTPVSVERIDESA